MALSLSPSSSSCKYEVFLSFRGEDTRDNFTSHLAAALRRKKIVIFIDDELKRGDEISPALLNAIESSKISVIIFSKNYAQSSWCLDELVKILECQKMNGQIVMPVFYLVDPSNVRKQTGSFGDAFMELAKRFKKMPERVQKWRAVLTEASNLSGWDSMKIKPESKLVDEIVKDIFKKLKQRSVQDDFEGFVGLHSRIEQIKSLLCMGLPDTRIVGIWGMGGIGKTTLAAKIFNQISDEFEGKSFMADVREESTRSGLVHLRERFVSEIFEENLKIGTPNLPGYIKERLQQMKVFIVLDDVNKAEQLEFLAGGLDRFGPGSRIIVTTRDKQVLDNCGVGYIYEVERLNYHEANELFCNHAFRQDHCTQDLQVLSESIRHYANGNPLALKVLGSSLYQKSKEEWENVLHKLQRIPDPRINDLLKISYDELNWEEKNIFLDIACFFTGHNKNQVTTILGDLYSVHYGLNVLVYKSLITIVNNELRMHDLLQEMGWKIVHEECEKEPGRRSRLWYHEHVCHVLKKHKGTDAIEGIFMDLSKINDIHLSSRAFANMFNLRLLKFYVSEHFSGLDTKNIKVHLPEGLEYLPDELRYLHWHGYPLETLPMNFSPENLIELSLPCSKIQQLWEGKKEATKLKSIDLRNSQYLTRIPDPSETPNLERINLSNCINLSSVPSSIQNFSNLARLCFEGCTSLSCFPPNIHFRSPIKIDLSFCINLKEFPQISGNVIDLNLRDTTIEEVPSSIKNLSSLENLNLWRCTSLTSVSTSICELKSLRRLDLSFCSKFQRFPEISEEMESLEYIALSSTKIKELPSSVELLTGLSKLKLSYCSELSSLPENLGHLKSLKFIEGGRLAVSLLPSSITDLNKLERIEFDECRGLVLPPLSGLSNLKELSLKDCDITEIPEDIGCLFSLELLDLTGNNFENLPKSIKLLSRMESLFLCDCNMLQSLPELHPRLENLSTRNCKQLKSLPELPERAEILDASILSESSDSFAWSRIRYIFSDCPKLKEKANDILADSQLRIKHMAIASLQLSDFSKKEYDKPARFDIYLPGSGNIPEWFSHRSSGSSITVQLPQHCCNSNLIGFALCAVYGFEDDSDASGLPLEIKYSYRSERKTLSTSQPFGDTVLTEHSFIDSDRIFLGFNPCWDVRIPDDDNHSAISFQFFIDYFIPDGKLPKVKCCGVCPLYAHPNKSPPNTCTINMVPPSEEECRSGTTGSINRSNVEEEETTCRDQINAPGQQSSFVSQIFIRHALLAFLIIFVILLFILTAIPHWKIGL